MKCKVCKNDFEPGGLVLVSDADDSICLLNDCRQKYNDKRKQGQLFPLWRKGIYEVNSADMDGCSIKKIDIIAKDNVPVMTASVILPGSYSADDIKEFIGHTINMTISKREIVMADPEKLDRDVALVDSITATKGSREKLEKLQSDGATDEEIKRFVMSVYTKEPGDFLSTPPWSARIVADFGAEPCCEFNFDSEIAFDGQALINKVRKLMDIPKAKR